MLCVQNKAVLFLAVVQSPRLPTCQRVPPTQPEPPASYSKERPGGNTFEQNFRILRVRKDTAKNSREKKQVAEKKKNQTGSRLLVGAS